MCVRACARDGEHSPRKFLKKDYRTIQTFPTPRYAIKVLTYTARFGPATEEDSCNLMQSDPSVLNVPAATRFSPTLSNVDIFNLATGELPSLATSSLPLHFSPNCGRSAGSHSSLFSRS